MSPDTAPEPGTPAPATPDGGAEPPRAERPPSRVLVVSENQALVKRLESLDLGHGPNIEVTACSRLADLGPMLDRAPGFDILLAGDLLAGSNGLKRLALVREELPQLSVVLAHDGVPHGNPTELVRTGAIDLLDLAVDDDDRIREALHRAAHIHQRLGTGASVEGAQAVDRHGRVFTVASASGGAGKTFLAVNLAWHLARSTGGRALIIDLDLQFGEVAAALHLQPRYSIADLVRYDEGQWYLTEYFEDFTTVHESGIQVLAATRDPTEAWGIKPADVDRIIAAARRRFDFVVIDTAPTISEAVVNAMRDADDVLVVATADVPSIRNMRMFLETIERFDVPKEHIRLVLNKAEKGLGLDPQVVQRLFPQGFEATIPISREVSRSLNAGEPVLVSAASTPVGRSLVAWFRQLVPTAGGPVGAGDGAGEKRPGGLFRRRNA